MRGGESSVFLDVSPSGVVVVVVVVECGAGGGMIG